MNRPEWVKWLIVIIELALIVGAVWGGIWLFRSIGFAEGAEDGGNMRCWVLCQPDSYVNVRRRASSRSEETGQAYCGMEMETDGTEQNGFVHIVNCGTEYGDGWISAGYIVYGEPEAVFAERTIRSNGRVACRKTIGGKRRCWVKDGQTVVVYMMTRSMAVTSRGFIERKWIE